MEWTYTVWDEPGLVYVAVPKVANTAVKAAFLESYVSDRKWANPHAGNTPYQEATPEDIGRGFPGRLAFTVVRNPFDRFVSFWTDKIVGHGWYKPLGALGFRLGMGFEEAAQVAAKIADARADPHFRSQISRLYDADGRAIPELVLRYENLADEWTLVQQLAARRAKRPLKALASRRPSLHMPWQDYYTPASEAAIARRYRDDFERLGYADRVTGGPTAADSACRTDPYDIVDRLQSGDLLIDATGYDPVRDQLCRGANAHYLPAGQIRGRQWHGEDPVRLAVKLVARHRVLLVAPADLDTGNLGTGGALTILRPESQLHSIGARPVQRSDDARRRPLLRR